MVIYLVCYDLSATTEVQNEQRAYWFNFLQSTLPTSSSPESRSKWRVLAVGTKRDRVGNQLKTPPDPLPSWQQKWPNLPFHDQHFAVSSHGMDGVQALVKDLQLICSTIFKQYTVFIPKTYKLLLKSVQTIPESQCIIPISQLKAAHWLGTHQQFNLAVKYLHAIGRIILLGGSMVCIRPQIIPKITAEFISPLDVRKRLLTSYQIEILDEQQIGVILNICKETTGYLSLLSSFSLHINI